MNANLYHLLSIDVNSVDMKLVFSRRFASVERFVNSRIESRLDPEKRILMTLQSFCCNGASIFNSIIL